jgi:hypothetical protein
MPSRKLTEGTRVGSCNRSPLRTGSYLLTSTLVLIMNQYLAWQSVLSGFQLDVREEARRRDRTVNTCIHMSMSLSQPASVD